MNSLITNLRQPCRLIFFFNIIPLNIIISCCLRLPQPQYQTVLFHTLALRHASFRRRSQHDSTHKTLDPTTKRWRWRIRPCRWQRLSPTHHPHMWSLGLYQFEATCILKGRVSYYNEEVCANSCTVILIEKNRLTSYLARRWHITPITCFRMRSCWRRRYESEAAGWGSSSLAEAGSSSSSLRRGFVFFRAAGGFACAGGSAAGRLLAAGGSAAANACANAALLAASLWRWDCW